MHDNPAEDWQALAQHYRQLGDEELGELAADFRDLTATAQEVLRNELRSRRLPEPRAAADAPQSTEAAPPRRWASSVDPEDTGDSGKTAHQAGDSEQSEAGDEPRDYTWKTPLCECETAGQAWEIHEALSRAGIDSWVEEPGRTWVSSPRVVVAADQLEEARAVAARPIPQEIVDKYEQEAPEFVSPKCPACGAEDPVLESANPSNCWLCEVCGKEWTEPAAAAEQGPEEAGT